MDVEQVQRINDLAVNLMKQGLVKDRDEAILQAQEILNSEQDLPTFNVNQTQKEEESALTEDQIKQILQQNSEFLVQTIKEFNRKIESLENQVSHLRKEVSQQRLPTVDELIEKEKQDKSEVSQIQQSEPTEPVSETAAPVPEPSPEVAPTEDKSESHPRSGNYNDNDVSIEKFFYMGPK